MTHVTVIIPAVQQPRQVINTPNISVIMPVGYTLTDTLNNWPRNHHGDLICTASRPMPPYWIKGQRWEHDSVKETDADSDYYIEYKCHSCGHVWRSEMPD